MFTLSRKQELFRNACNIIRQGCSANELNNYHSCSYNGTGNTHCALGWSLTHLSQEEVNSLEGSVPEFDDYENEPNYIAKALGATDQEDIAFLRDLQKCHDTFASFPRDRQPLMFAGALMLFARLHNTIDSYCVNEALNDFETGKGIV